MVPRPATAPEIAPGTEGLPRWYHSRPLQTQDLAQAARCVTTIANAVQDHL